MRGAIPALAAAVAVASSGCSAVLYYGFPEKTTAEVDRRSRVVVRSYPAGATIVGSRGEVLGAAPLVAEVDYKVRSTTIQNSTLRGALGCAIDTAAFVGATVWSVSALDSTVADVAFYGSLGLLSGCIALALTKAINAVAMRRLYSSMQAPQILSAPLRRSREVIAGSAAIGAHWTDGGSARAVLSGPGQSEVLLIQPPARTFDEALMRYDERRGRPLGVEGRFRRGAAYYSRARETGDTEAARRARADLETVLADPAIAASRAQKIRSMLGELAAVGGAP